MVKAKLVRQKISLVWECRSTPRERQNKFACQRWNTLSLKVTWRRKRMIVKNLSG